MNIRHIPLAILLALSLLSPVLVRGDGCGHELPDWPAAPQSPDFAETLPEGAGVLIAPASETEAARAMVTAPGQPVGALAGRVIYASAGHGWTYVSGAWTLQRPLLAEMNEDYGNLDQMMMFAQYCFNAGATVVPMRPMGHQTNEVVLDNNSSAVTFSGAWFTNTTNPTFYGPTNGVRYHYALISNVENATATFTPTIPVAGLYPVYCWAAHGGDRVSQLYRIRHTGGEAKVRVPHDLVGNGWVYLGTYYFATGSNAASGAVIVSNLEPVPGSGGLVIADAIRFGNGMGTIDRGGGVSTYPREEECSRYWVQHSLGMNQSTDIYDNPGLNDLDDNVGTPPRMAREMNREAGGTMFKRLFLSFHSNATTGNTNTATARGSLALYNTTVADQTPNQVLWASIAGKEVNDDLVSLSSQLEVPWFNRGAGITLAGSYGEIRNSSISNEFDATLIEVAFHDQTSDLLLLRDVKARNWAARAAYHAVVRYMNTNEGVPLNFLPEPPIHVRAVGVSNGIQVSWSTPVAQAGSGAPGGYQIYRSTDGYGFGNPVAVAAGGNSVTLTNLDLDVDYYFRVSATNAGGESFPSETVACRRSSGGGATRILFVNDYDRFERTINVRQSPLPLNYKPPGATGVVDRAIAARVNSFDYVVQHVKALAAAGVSVDSCASSSVTNSQILLTNYPVVAWAAGQSITNSFSSAERAAVTNFLVRGGHLFVSGSEIAWELDRAAGPSVAQREFLNNFLHAGLGDDTNNNSQSHALVPVGGAIFAGNAALNLDDGLRGTYFTQTPDVPAPNGSGASVALTYANGRNAAIQYDGSAGGGKVVYFGFPFETITNAAARTEYMADILTFFNATGGSPPEFRAFWADTFNAALFNATQVTQLVSNLRTANCNAVFVEVRRRGDAFYNSSIEPKNPSVTPPSFDPLATLISLAHNTTNGPRIEVHAWIVTYPIWNNQSTPPAAPTHPYNLHPDWLTQDDLGATWNGGNYVFDPGHPGVQEHTYNVAMDIITNYDVDGLNFDYVRYEDSTWGYNPVAVARFNAQYGLSGQPATSSALWKQWRRDQVTALVRKVYLSAIEVKPQIKISADTITFAPGITNTSQWTGSSAYNSVLQDWRAWMEEGIIDLNVPMAYFQQTTTHSNSFANWSLFIKNHRYNRHAAIGCGLYLNSIENGILQMRSTRVATPSNNVADGVVGYSYAAPASNVIASLQATFFNALTQPSSYDPIMPPIFANPVTPPVMPWKAMPTKGHLKGVVTLAGSGVELENAVVNIAGPTNRVVTTDATGFYGAVDLLPGSYSVYATHSGVFSPTGLVSIVAGAVSNLNFVIGAAPVINAQPGSRTNFVGSTATFTVVAGGTVPLSYQWFKGAGPVPSATNSTLTLTNVQFSDAAAYTVVVTNFAGSVTSAPAVLTVTLSGAPVITVQPAGQILNLGGVASYSVVSTSAPPLAYQWMFNGDAIAGATNSTYNIMATQITQAGMYAVAISNNNGSVTSSFARLVVLNTSGVPTAFADDFETSTSNRWIELPGYTNAVPDYTATYAHSYTNYFSAFLGTTLPPSPNSEVGATRGLRLTANNNDGLAAIAAVSLFPKWQTFEGAHALKFDMWMNYPGGTGGSGAVGSTENSHFGLNCSGTRTNWDFTTAAPSDGVWFTVTGEGGAANDYRAHVGGTNGPPVWLAFSASGLGASGAVSANASSPPWTNYFPSPAYQTAGSPGKRWVEVEVSQTISNVLTWRMNNHLIAQRTNNTVFTNGNLMLGYADLFTSIASPAADAFVLYDNVRVELEAAALIPFFTLQPMNQTQIAGQPVTLVAEATGLGPISYQWQRASTNLPGATNAILNLPVVQLTDAGTYVMLAANAAGTNTSDVATLTVEPGVSTTSTNLTFTASSGSLTLSWPADHTGWRLETQTNSLATGLGTNWFTVPGSAATNQLALPMTPAHGVLFFRLIYP